MKKGRFICRIRERNAGWKIAADKETTPGNRCQISVITSNNLCSLCMVKKESTRVWWCFVVGNINWNFSGLEKLVVGDGFCSMALFLFSRSLRLKNMGINVLFVGRIIWFEWEEGRGERWLIVIFVVFVGKTMRW